jgi:hypothetical protein
VGVTTVANDLIVAAEEGWSGEELRALLRRLVPDYEASLAGMPVRQEGARRESGGSGVVGG